MGHKHGSSQMATKNIKWPARMRDTTLTDLTKTRPLGDQTLAAPILTIPGADSQLAIPWE